MSAHERVVVGFREFESLWCVQAGFLERELGFPALLFWEFGDTISTSVDDDRLRIVTWCGSRDASVWTYFQRPQDLATLGLDTVSDLRGDEVPYPTYMGDAWSAEGFRERVALEAGFLRRHAAPVLAGELTAAFAGPGRPDSLRLDNPVDTFPRECLRRLGFLASEFDCRPIVDGEQEVLFVRRDLAVLAALQLVGHEDEEEADWELGVQVAEVDDAGVPSELALEDGELELGRRRGPFTTDYLAASFEEAERVLRNVARLTEAGNG